MLCPEFQRRSRLAVPARALNRICNQGMRDFNNGSVVSILKPVPAAL
jgi:hypothetical protein